MGGGDLSVSTPFFVFVFFVLSYHASRKNKNKTLTTLTSILSPSFNLKKSEVEELRTRKKSKKLLQFQMIVNITEISKENHASRTVKIRKSRITPLGQITPHAANLCPITIST